MRQLVEYDSFVEPAAVRIRVSRWIWITSIWFGLGLFDATQTVFTMHAEGMHHAWGKLFVTLLLSMLPWAVATPIILNLSRLYPLVQVRPISTWLRHLGTAAVVGFAASGWVAWLETSLNPWLTTYAPKPFIYYWLDKFYSQLLSSLLLYGFVLTISYIIDSRERMARHQTETARLNEQLSRAQLSALQRQMEPHFLFNALNAVSGLVREGRNDDAVQMIAGLSDCLRRVLEDCNRQQVPLGEEVEFLQKYLDIQKVRFGSRLQCNVDVAQDLFPAQVPSLILQPMVENAVKHGISKRAKGGEIRIAASRSDGMLVLRIYNDGPSLPPNWEQAGSGIGIANVRTRLQSLYGDASQLIMRNLEPGGVEVSVSLPFREASA
ncbi:MAG TPA: histidine kinase [Candidatus Angelobacter sp.]|nr:histidine kinase [Candidatus Angelobacter sp.]